MFLTDGTNITDYMFDYSFDYNIYRIRKTITITNIQKVIILITTILKHHIEHNLSAFMNIHIR